MYFDPVNDDPVITTTDIYEAQEDSLYENTYNGTDVDGDTLGWKLSTNGSWLKRAANRIYGTPLQEDVGVFWVNVSCNDNNGSVIVTNFTLIVNPTQDAPEFIKTVPDVQFFEDGWATLQLNTSAIDERTIKKVCLKGIF